MFNRRTLAAGAAAGAVLATSALTAGTALADTTPQLTNPAASLLQVGPASSLPGLTGILQAVPAGSLTSPGSASPGSSPASGLSGATSGVSNLSGATGGSGAASDSGASGSGASGSPAAAGDSLSGA